jgi:hypothetical protein
MPGFFKKLAKGVEEFVTEFNKAYTETQKTSGANAGQSSHNPYGNNGSQVTQTANNLGQQLAQPYPQQPYPQQQHQQHQHQYPTAPGLTPAEQSRLNHIKNMHAQASQICTSLPVIDPRYPEGDRRRYGR